MHTHYTYSFFQKCSGSFVHEVVVTFLSQQLCFPVRKVVIFSGGPCYIVKLVRVLPRCKVIMMYRACNRSGPPNMAGARARVCITRADVHIILIWDSEPVSRTVRARVARWNRWGRSCGA